MNITAIFKKLKSLFASESLPSTPVTPSQPTTVKEEETISSTEVKTYHATGMEHRMADLFSLGHKNVDFSKSKKELIKDELVGERVWEWGFYARKVELVPEPDNPYDPKAIKVVADGVHIAYIKKGSCAHLHKVIREGRMEAIKCKIGGGNYKYISEDWEDEDVTYTLEKNSAPYFVWLYITERI